ncbi:hypothetical protein [Paraburkholderia sp. HP33-1]|uniref:hypothetical protein n=1 Tax=Paraburkholderia sp. HP33-1 TaxID=2883243 RepID=UPI001F15B65A|nr:hypothetical protein [Paraburkholderia sp. HP33-1]
MPHLSRHPKQQPASISLGVILLHCSKKLLNYRGAHSLAIHPPGTARNKKAALGKRGFAVIPFGANHRR